MSLVGVNFTIFIVEQKQSLIATNNTNYLIGGLGNTYKESLQFSYNNSGAFSTGTRGQLVPAYNNIQVTKQAPVMHSFTFSKTAGMKYWANGGINADATASVNTTPLTNPGGYATRIGNYFYSDKSFSYNGYVAEYIPKHKSIDTLN